MLRVLLVSEAQLDFETRTLCARLAASDDASFSLLHFALPPSGVTTAGIRRLLTIDATNELDVIHAIGPAALLAVSAIGCKPVVYTPPPDQPLSRKTILRMVSVVRQVRVVCNSTAARRELVRAGIRAENITVMPPLLPESTPMRRSDRAALGLEASHRVLLAVGESTLRASHERVLHTAVILRFLDPRYRLLLWGRGPAAGRVRRFADSLQQPDFCVFAEQLPGESVCWQQLVAVADAAMAAPTGATSTLEMTMCRAAGLAVFDVAHPRHAAQEVHRHFELPGVTPPSAPKPASATVQQWKALYSDVRVGREPATFQCER